MSVKKKKRITDVSKILISSVIIILLFTNIKVALNDDVKTSDGKLSLLGLELQLFESTYAQSEMTTRADLCLDAYVRCRNQCAWQSLGGAIIKAWVGPLWYIGCTHGCAIGYNRCMG